MRLRLVLLAGGLAAVLTANASVGATAEDITRSWPAGSIRTVEQAEAARSAVRAVEIAAEQAWRASRTASATAMPAGCHACHAHPHHGGQ